MRFRALPLLGVLLAGPAFAYVTPGPMFEAAGRLFASGPTYNVVLEDVNLDGRADLVVGNSIGLAVALSTGAGGFGPFLHSFPELSSVSVSVGDFDGDGLPDVAGGYELGVYVGFGDGTGAWPESFVLPGHEPGGPVIPQVADLNGDGRSDLIEKDRDSTYSVYIAQGDRTLTHAGTISFAPGFYPFAIAIGDVTGSSAPDLVVTFYETPYVGILPGNGDGTFGAESDLPIASGSYGVALGAADAGAPLDLFLHHETLGIDFAGGSGGGAFGSFSTLSGSGSGFDILLRDFNHDGTLDVVTYHFTRPYRVATFAGDGAGGFGPRVDSPELVYPLYSFVTGDVDGDGNFDLAGVQNPTFPAFALTRGRADGTFGDGPLSPPRISGSLRAGVAGDFDGDGKLDALGWNETPKKLAFARGRGDGTFDPIAESAALPLAYLYAAAGRFDGDANLDLVLVAGSPATLSFLHGNGNGTFAAPVDWALGASPNEPTVVDLDGNGKLDVVVPCAGASSLRVFMQGPGGLAAPLTSATPAGPVAVRYTDLNGDGRLDRVLACTNQVVEQFDDGAGGWTTVLSHAQTFTPTDVAIADVDEDGYLDAISNEDTGVTAFSPSPILRVLHGQPGGVFGGESTVNIDFDPGHNVGRSRNMFRFFARDLDEDGHVDLVGRGSSLMYLSAHGRGDGTFERAESYIGPAMSRSIDLGDFDGDGHLDVLGCGQGGQSPNITTTFMVLRNRTGGVVGVPPAPSAPIAAIALAAPFPNPARSAFTLRFRVPSREAVTVDVVSVAGRRVLSRRIEPAGAGDQTLRLDGLDGLSAGVYAVVISQGEERASTRVVVMP